MLDNCHCSVTERLFSGVPHLHLLGVCHRTFSFYDYELAVMHKKLDAAIATAYGFPAAKKHADGYKMNFMRKLEPPIGLDALRPAPLSVSSKGNPDVTAQVSHPRDPLHGITLEQILNQLVQRHGWGEMGRRIPIRCFQFNPTVKSSLTFLRKTPWARQKVELWYLSEL